MSILGHFVMSGSVISHRDLWRWVLTPGRVDRCSKGYLLLVNRVNGGKVMPSGRQCYSFFCKNCAKENVEVIRDFHLEKWEDDQEIYFTITDPIYKEKISSRHRQREAKGIPAHYVAFETGAHRNGAAPVPDRLYVFASVPLTGRANQEPRHWVKLDRDTALRVERNVLQLPGPSQWPSGSPEWTPQNPDTSRRTSPPKNKFVAPGKTKDVLAKGWREGADLYEQRTADMVDGIRPVQDIDGLVNAIRDILGFTP